MKEYFKNNLYFYQTPDQLKCTAHVLNISCTRDYSWGKVL